MRVCEELYYHSAHNPKYIYELNIALQEIGIKAKETKEIQLELKVDFKESAFYKNGLVFLNRQIKYDRSGLFALPNTIREHIFHVNLFSGAVESTTIFNNAASSSKKTKQIDYMLEDFGFYVIKKAISKLEFYRFQNLKSFLPNLKSIQEFIISDNYLKKIRVEVEGEERHIASLTLDEKLKITVSILEKISQSLESEKVEYQGTPEFYQQNVSKIFIEPKGAHLLKDDEWKENFLKSLKEKHRINVLWKSKKYTVWGMPFYNEVLRKTEFETEFWACVL